MKLTIIIPVYNAEDSISACLGSIIDKQMDAVELVIVDDGSSDATLQRIDGFIKAHADLADKVKLLRHGQNLGVLASRRDGVAAATGDYLTFVDADDTVVPGSYARLMAELESTGADMLSFKYNEYCGDEQHVPKFGATLAAEKGRRVRDAIALQTSPFLWTKLVKASFFDNINFPPENMAEDWAICVQYAMLADRVAVLDEALYNYNINPNSVSHDSASDDKVLKRAMSEKANVEFVESLLRERGLSERYSKEIEARKSNVKRLMLPLLHDRKNNRIWRECFSEINFRILANGYIPLEYKVKHVSAMLGLYKPLYSVFKRLSGK